MRALWLYALLALCSLGVALAQNDTCDISLGGFDSVLAIYHSVQELAAQLVVEVLNFLLAANFIFFHFFFIFLFFPGLDGLPLPTTPSTSC